MEESEVKELCDEVRSLAKQICSSLLHLNNLRLLCELCEENSEKVQYTAIHETFRVFEHIMTAKPQYRSAFIFKRKMILQQKKAKATDEAEDQIIEFLHEQYKDFVIILLSKHLGNKESLFQIPTIKILFRLVLLEHKIATKGNKGSTNPMNLVSQFNSSAAFIDNIVLALIRGVDNTPLVLMSSPELLEVIREFFHEYDDLRFYMIKSIGKACKKRQKVKLASKETIDTFVLNVFQLLHQLPVPEEQTNFYIHDPSSDAACRFLFNRKKAEPESFAEMYKVGKKRKGEERNEKDKELMMKEVAAVFDMEENRIVFEYAWKQLLRLQLSPLVYKQILLDLPIHVIPHFRKPELFGDFFTDAYDMGGMSSVLALQGIFVLISRYNFEYKEFYKKLYGLLQPNIFLVKYSGRFFELCRLFFGSSYLPQYLCAAFCKRLIRLGLKAPAPSFVPVLPLVHNIMLSHSQLTELLHRPSKIASNSVLMVKVDDDTVTGEDPFDMEEEDPSKSKAQQSSLWEIKALRKHYYPIISRFCKAFEKPIDAGRQPYEIKDFLHQTYETEFQSQITRKRKGKATPLTFSSSGKLFSQEEHEGTFPCWDFN